jgi:hypothetical protein
MISPFPGLSTIVHLLIIAVKKTVVFGVYTSTNRLQLQPKKTFQLYAQRTKDLKEEKRTKEELIKPRKKKMRLFPAVIIASVLFSIAGSSGMIVGFAALGSGSNLKFIESSASKLNKSYYGDISINTLNKAQSIVGGSFMNVVPKDLSQKNKLKII